MTGVAGFIATNIALHLVQAGHVVLGAVPAWARRIVLSPA